MVCAQADFLEVVRRPHPADSRQLEFDVSCHPSGTGDSRQGSIQVQVSTFAADPALPSQRLSFLLPVYAADPAPLVIAPRLATLQAGSDGQPWSGQLIVTGDAVAAGADVRQIHCATGRIAYHSTRIASSALRVDLDWWPIAWRTDRGRHQIELELTNGERRRANVRLSPLTHERTLP